ncbi:hypothetical protein ACN9M0_24930 [Streptomyces sp. R-07]|uniref:hypothetical protein n=1 Tax=Streptomyces sp. R-07 TaxID=3404052 RepID=UPI003CF11B91
MTTLRFEKAAPLIPFSDEARSEVAEALKLVPGRWALLGRRKVAGSARQDAYSVRNGKPGWAMFGTGFEAEMRTLFGEHRIYVRYVGAAQ